MPPAAAYPPAAPGGDVASRYYSLDVGGVHLVLFDTETPEDTGDVEAGEVAWLRADLAAHANATWTVCGAHRPFYCTNGGATDKDCAVFAGVMRAQVEAVFVAGGADVVLGAHMHGYEATQAVNASRVVASRGPGGVFPPAPGAPVYVVNGAAGNREGNEDPAGDAAWSVPGAHSGAIGFAVLTASPRFLNVTFFAAAPDGTTTQIDFFAIPAN